MSKSKLLWLPSVLLSTQIHLGTVWAKELPVFTTPPTAQELADIMFPEKTRSIVFLNEDNNVSQAENPQAENDGTNTEEAPTDANTAPSAFGLLINFEYGKATINDEAKAYLDAVGGMLKLEQAANKSLLIEGHTDASGSEKYNQYLSEQRAKAVRDYLINNYGIELTRLYSVGQGELRLHDSTNPNAAINRRVEFKLVQ